MGKMVKGGDDVMKLERGRHVGGIIWLGGA